MAAPTSGSSKDRKGKRAHKNKPTSTKYAHYVITGDSIKKSKSCPRCGPGIFLAVHKERLYCGKCHYTEFTEKKA